MTGLIALLGGTVAAGSHATKAGTRVAANTTSRAVQQLVPQPRPRTRL